MKLDQQDKRALLRCLQSDSWPSKLALIALTLLSFYIMIAASGNISTYKEIPEVDARARLLKFQDETGSPIGKPEFCSYRCHGMHIARANSNFGISAFLILLIATVLHFKRASRLRRIATVLQERGLLDEK